VDAALARRCPICGQNIETNEARDYARLGGYERALQQHMKTAHPAEYDRSRRLGIALIPLLFSALVLPFIPLSLEAELGAAITAILSISGFIVPLSIFAAIGRHSQKGAKTSLRTSLRQPKTLNPFNPQATVPPVVSNAGPEILGIAKDLGQRLDINGFEPESILWQEYFTHSFARNLVLSAFTRGQSNRPVMIPYDGCIFHGNQILLPLIASELIYQRKLVEKRLVGLLLRILPLTAVYIIAPVILWQVGLISFRGATPLSAAPTPAITAFFALVIGTSAVFALILYIVLGLRYDSQMRLKADTLATELTGKTVFLSALQKIGTAFPELMTKGRPSIEYPLGRPTVGKRIEAVRNMTAF
jgi:hypothetical protein